MRTGFHALILGMATSVFLSVGTPIAAADNDRSRAENAPIVRVKFAAMGDVPYSPEESEQLVEQIDQLPDDIDFVVHLGDIKPGFFPCLDVMYGEVAATLRGSKAPCFIIPGDNEWNECPRAHIGPIHWRRHFLRLEEHWEHEIEVARQEDYEENFAFVHNRVLFIGLNLVAGRVLDEEAWNARLNANADWVQQHVESRSREVDSMVVFAHAGPGENQEIFFERFEASSRWFLKPVLLMHGNGHRWRSDRPFDVRHIRRVQVDQGGIAPPVIVSVTIGEGEPFKFERGERYASDE